MSDILAEIVEVTATALTSQKSRVSVADLRSLPGYGADRRGFGHSLQQPSLSIIAEHKRRSPSKGPIREDLALADVVAAYSSGGAAAISVLTEPRYFGGSLRDLSDARAMTDLPILRKDFIVDSYQIVEARAFGADAILLIAAAIDDALLADLHAEAIDEGLDVLVEVHSVAELDSVDLDLTRLIGVNNRDLRTFEVDLNTSARVFPLLPHDIIRVSESGYHTDEDISRAVEMGADAVLIGERLMRDADATSVIESWLRIDRTTNRV